MPFSYTAIDASGASQSGVLDVNSKNEAYRLLEKLRLTPVSIAVATAPAGAENSGTTNKNTSKEVTDSSGKLAIPDKPVSLSKANLVLFTEELSDLLDSGLQLEQALRIMHERQEDESVKGVAARMRDEIRDGSSVAKALPHASPSFDSLYINMVAAGEASGSLPQILKRLAHNQQIMNELNAKVLQALIYPAFMVGGCILLMVVFMVVLVPQLTELLGKTGQDLPASTQMLVNISSVVTRFWWLILIVVVAGLLIFKAIISTPRGRFWWDGAKLRLPLFGPVLAYRFYAQFCQALANLVTNGVPLLNGLKLMRKATPNTYLSKHLNDVTEFVGEGGALSIGLRKTEAFPMLLSDMCAVGEQTGDIGHSLGKAAVRYDKQLDRRIKRLTALISPIILVLMAGVVTVVAYSIITAIFQSVNGIRG